MRANGTNDYGWKYLTLNIDRSNLDQFELMVDRRRLRETNVSKLKGLLEKDEHFETPFVVNIKNKKYRLIDGNHRFEAISRFIKKWPLRSVNLGLCCYENLSTEEEKEKFIRWNSGGKQTKHDFLKLYYSEIPVTKKLKKPGFPVNVTSYPTPGNLDFSILANTYLESKTKNITKHRTILEFVEECKKLKQNDFNIMKQMVSDFITLFGMPDKLNPHYKAINFYAIGNIWLKNYNNTLPYEMLRRLAKLRGCERVIYWSTHGGTRVSTNQARNDLLEIVNLRQKAKLFI